MDTPPALRGQFYSTHLTQRCPNYKQCKRCLMCASYNPHNVLCQLCESFKPAARHHECTNSQLEATAIMDTMMEKVTGRPRFDINAEPKDVTVDLCTTSFNSENANLVKHITELQDTST
jgi:hypothetical protein